MNGRTFPGSNFSQLQIELEEELDLHVISSGVVVTWLYTTRALPAAPVLLPLSALTLRSGQWLLTVLQAPVNRIRVLCRIG